MIINSLSILYLVTIITTIQHIIISHSKFFCLPLHWPLALISCLTRCLRFQNYQLIFWRDHQRCHWLEFLLLPSTINSWFDICLQITWQWKWPNWVYPFYFQLGKCSSWVRFPPKLCWHSSRNAPRYWYQINQIHIHNLDIPCNTY